MSEQNPPEKKGSGGCAKVLGVMLVLGLLGTVVAGAVGTYIYLNWEKWGMEAMEDLKAKMGKGENGKEAVKRPVVASVPKQGTSANYAQWMQRRDVLVLVDYYADWCPPCKQLVPQLEALAKNHGDKVVILKVNVDKEKELAMNAGVESIPDLRLLHGGKQLEKIIGYRPASQLEQMVVRHAGVLPPPSGPQVLGADGTGTIEKMSQDWLPPGVTPAN